MAVVRDETKRSSVVLDLFYECFYVATIDFDWHVCVSVRNSKLKLARLFLV
jgi:hypothetical protein